MLAAIHSFVMSDFDLSKEIRAEGLKPETCKIDSIEYKPCYKYRTGTTLVEIVQLVEVKLRFESESPADVEVIDKEWFKLSCIGHVDKYFEDFFVKNVEVYNCITPSHENTLDGNLVPYYASSELDNVAIRILEQFYPEALYQLCRIDALELTRRMNLNVYSNRIKEDNSILDQIYFYDTTTMLPSDNFVYQEVFLPGGSILINPLLLNQRKKMHTILIDYLY